MYIRVHGVDPTYVMKRNALISQAERHADEAIRRLSASADSKEWNAAWNHAYHTRMDELARANGLGISMQEVIREMETSTGRLYLVQ